MSVEAFSNLLLAGMVVVFLAELKKSWDQR
jgi:hypothetical protein